MALSEREQQMLEQMEQALRAEDPHFASQMNGSPRRPEDRRRLALGAIGALAGLGLVILGINTNMWVGVAGFALIVGSIALAAAPRRPEGSEPGLGVVTEDGSVARPARRPRAPRRRLGLQKGSGPARGSSFMERLEQRWDNRRRDRQGW